MQKRDGRSVEDLLRFRVWDTVKKAMSEVQAIVYTEERVYPIYFKAIRGYIPFSEAIIMQSTRLLDKNGKEIFESDIVEWEHKDTGQLVRGIVKYDTELGFWGMTDVRFNDLRAIGYLANQRVTVLGNIFEHIHLL